LFLTGFSSVIRPFCEDPCRICLSSVVTTFLRFVNDLNVDLFD